MAESIIQNSETESQEPSIEIPPGDGLQIKSNVTIEQVGSVKDQSPQEEKQSHSSAFSSAEMQRRMSLRLQKLAEYENAQNKWTEMTNVDGEEGGDQAQTWQKFWQNVEKTS